MPRITINLNQEDQASLDYICAHNRRTRSEQVSRWVYATLTGELVETPKYEDPQDMPVDLSQEEADKLMAEVDVKDIHHLAADGKTILDQNDEVVGELSPECAYAIGMGKFKSS